MHLGDIVFFIFSVISLAYFVLIIKCIFDESPSSGSKSRFHISQSPAEERELNF